jgi:hypothetical protein
VNVFVRRDHAIAALTAHEDEIPDPMGGFYRLTRATIAHRVGQ